MKRALWTVLAVVAFVGVLVMSTLEDQKVECEVCVETAGRVYCATASAPDRDAALGGALSNACGTAAEGMNAELQCRNSPPRSAHCQP